MIFSTEETERSGKRFREEDRIRKKTRRIWFFGAGALGAWLCEYFSQTGFSVAGFVDNNPERLGTKINGRPIVAFKEYAAHNDKEDFLVLGIAEGAGADAVQKQCGVAGVKLTPYYDAMAVFRIGCFSEPMTAAEIQENPDANQALDIWADQESHDKYVRFLKYHALRDPAFFYPREDMQYFSPKYMPRNYLANFVDIGAYTGDTLRQFMEYTEGNFEAYHGFEPDPDIFAELARSPYAKDHRVHLYDIAIGSKSKTAHMKRCALSASTVKTDGDIEVKMDTLEHALRDSIPTLIKLDIEGGEPYALKGAENVFANHRPALAVSVYHRTSHFWSLPLFIKRLHPEYKLRLGCHSNHYGEVICYAIP